MGLDAGAAAYLLGDPIWASVSLNVNECVGLEHLQFRPLALHDSKMPVNSNVGENGAWE